MKRQTTKWEELFEINVFSVASYPENIGSSNKLICNRKIICWKIWQSPINRYLIKNEK